MTTALDAVLSVGLGELKTARAGGGLLMALGLGSCVGVALYDPVAKAGGLAHVVLPAPLDPNAPATAKFANVAVPLLLEQVLALGTHKSRLVCKIAGGAQVLAAGRTGATFRIGERNVEAVHEALKALGIRVAAADCGGSSGRSMRLDVAAGRVTVKRLGKDWDDL